MATNVTAPIPEPLHAYTAEVYSRSGLVDYLHSFQHYGGADEFSLDGEYWVAIEVMFYATCAAGLMLIVLQWVFFCFEPCCRCCTRACARCPLWVGQSLLGLLFAWLLAGTGLVYWGRSRFQEGASSVYWLSEEVRKVLATAESNIQAQLVARAQECMAKANAAACRPDYGFALMSESSAFEVSSLASLELVRGLGPVIEDIGQLFQETIPSLIDWGVGLVTGLMSLTAFFGLATVACCSSDTGRTLAARAAASSKSPWGAGLLSAGRGFLAAAGCTLVVLLPAVAFELTLSVLVADFCVGLESQDRSIVVLAEKHAPSATLPLVTYFLSCLGPPGPLAERLDGTAADARTLGATASFYRVDPMSFCDPAQLNAMQTLTVLAAADAASIQDAAQCRSVNEPLSEMAYEAVCNTVVEGVYRVWTVQMACALSLWALLFLTQAYLLAREEEGRLELAAQEQRLGLAPSSLVPKRGTRARKKYDLQSEVERLALDQRLAAELKAESSELETKEADQAAEREAAAAELLRWVVRALPGEGPDRRKEAWLRIQGHQTDLDHTRERKKRIGRIFDPDREAAEPR